MASPLPTYLRKHRRKWALSQRELAELLGGTARSRISQYERLVRAPSTEALIGLEFIFGEPPHGLFPGVGLSVIRAVLGNAVILRDEVLAKSDAVSARKRHLLDSLITRSVSLLTSYE